MATVTGFDLARYDDHEDKRAKRIENGLKSIDGTLKAIVKELEGIEKSIEALKEQQYDSTINDRPSEKAGQKPLASDPWRLARHPMSVSDTEGEENCSVQPGSGTTWDKHSSFLLGLDEYND